MMMSWFTRNAADHARCTAPSRCFAPYLTDLTARVDGAREPVMNLSVVATRLSMRSMNRGSSEDDQRRQLPPLEVSEGNSIYQKRSPQAHPSVPYEVCGDMSLHALCVPWLSHVHGVVYRHRLSRKVPGRRLRQIW